MTDPSEAISNNWGDDKVDPLHLREQTYQKQDEAHDGKPGSYEMQPSANGVLVFLKVVRIEIL